MRQTRQQIDPDILQSALTGLEMQRAKIEEQIQNVQTMINGKRGRPFGSRNNKSAAAKSVATKKKPKRAMSDTAKKAIGDATRERWAKYRAESEEKSAVLPKKAVAKKTAAKATKKATKKAAKKTTASDGAATAEEQQPVESAAE